MRAPGAFHKIEFNGRRPHAGAGRQPSVAHRSAASMPVEPRCATTRSSSARATRGAAGGADRPPPARDAAHHRHLRELDRPARRPAQSRCVGGQCERRRCGSTSPARERSRSTTCRPRACSSRARHGESARQRPRDRPARRDFRRRQLPGAPSSRARPRASTSAARATSSSTRAGRWPSTLGRRRSAYVGEPQVQKSSAAWATCASWPTARAARRRPAPTCETAWPHADRLTPLIGVRVASPAWGRSPFGVRVVCRRGV